MTSYVSSVQNIFPLKQTYKGAPERHPILRRFIQRGSKEQRELHAAALLVTLSTTKYLQQICSIFKFK